MRLYTRQSDFVNGYANYSDSDFLSFHRDIAFMLSKKCSHVVGLNRYFQTRLGTNW